MAGSSGQVSAGPGLFILAITVVAPVLAFVVSVLADFGAEADPGYYVTVAGVSGVIFALELPAVALLREVLNVNLSVTYLRRLFVALLFQVALPVGLCLIALAQARSTTFLLLGAAFSLFIQIFSVLFYTWFVAFPTVFD
jgi:hypothetical protein